MTTSTDKESIVPDSCSSDTAADDFSQRLEENDNDSSAHSTTSSARSNARPFAQSAAKRNSVQALGSIHHLQELYTKHGL